MRAFAAICLGLLLADPALAETITLTSDVLSSKTRVYEIGSDMILDLNGHTITCAPADPSTDVTFGVYAANTENVTIRNGSITGCFFGVHGGGASNLRIENVDFTGNTYIGAHLSGATGAVVIGSTFADIAGYAVEAYAIGVNGVGSDALIKGNTCKDMYRQPEAAAGKRGEGVCILVSAGSTDVVIEGNRAINAVVSDDIGIWIARGSTARVEGNIIAGFARGIIAAAGTHLIAVRNAVSLARPFEGSVGLYGSQGKADENRISGFETPIGGSISGSGNQIDQAAMRSQQ